MEGGVVSDPTTVLSAITTGLGNLQVRERGWGGQVDVDVRTPSVQGGRPAPRRRSLVGLLSDQGRIERQELDRAAEPARPPLLPPTRPAGGERADQQRALHPLGGCWE